MDTAAGGRVATMTEMFALGGDMGALMATMDWSRTPLGPVEAWPQSLRTAASICLTSRFPMIVWWGPQLIFLYNDDYRPILGAKHPRSLGQPGLECWAEVRDIIGPMLNNVLQTGAATWSEDQFLPLERNGYVEECYFTFSYSPIFDETGGVGGVFTAVTETTVRVLGERRMRILRELAAGTAQARSVEEACALAMATLATDTADLPFSLLYLYDDDGTCARLVGSSGLDFDPAAGQVLGAPIMLDDTDACPWPRPGAVAERLPDAARRLGGMGARCRLLAPDEALVMSVMQPGQERPYGFLVAGVSPHLALEDTYHGFFDLVAGHLATAISNARAYEQERRRAEALAEIDRAKTVFFSNVSHEFRTPLTLMLGPVEDMRGDAESMPPHRREQLELIHRNGLRLLKLVNTLLDFSRIEAGRVEATYTPVDLAVLTADLASVFRSLIEKAGLRLVVDCAPLPEAVYVDRDMWEQIVLNLLSNAFKFTFEGEIAVTLRAHGSHVELEVRDTGVGIPDTELPHLFERFHRVQGGRSRTYEGSGIGLALVQELVRLHSGTIGVTSQLGEGSRFTVTIPTGTAHLPADHIKAERNTASTALGAIPFIEEAGRWLTTQDGEAREDASDSPALSPLSAMLEAQHQRATPPAIESTPHPSKILLADDNADMRDYVQRILARRWQVRTVANGRTAVQLAQDEAPDLILCDVMMPELDGLQVVRQLRADPRTRAIPVILLSARAGQEAAIEGLEAGADDYLVKPFSARELEARVASHLELAHLRQQTFRQASELEAVLNSMTDAVLVFDVTGETLHSNAAARALLGNRALPGIAVPAADAHQVLLDLRDEHGRLLAVHDWPQSRVLRGEVLTASRAVDVQVRTLDAQDAQLNMTGAPVRDASGRILGGILVCRDVTERRRLERRTQDALQALLAMAETLVQTADDTQPDEQLPAPTASRAGQRLVELTRQVINCQAAALVTLDPDTLRVAPVAIVGLTPAHASTWWADVPHTPLNGFYSMDVIERLRARETVLVDLEQQPLLNQADYGVRRVLIVPMCIGQRIIGLVAIEHSGSQHTYTAADLALVEGIARLAALVIERERLLREREAARARELALVEANRRMDTFLGIAAHELKTPLTSVKANLQIAERRLDGRRPANDRAVTLTQRVASTAPLLQRSGVTISRLDRLIDDLLDVSRIQEDKLQLRLEPCDLAQVVREAVEEQRQLQSSRVVRLELPVAEGVPVVADAERIGQVITNYLTNAFKYSEADRPVAVSLHVVEDQARVSVRDQGPGVPRAEQALIWDRFHRVPGIEVRSGSGIGLGLGLFICRTMVERHGGQVGIESAPGQGSTFWFTLPLASPTAAPQAGRAPLL